MSEMYQRQKKCELYGFAFLMGIITLCLVFYFSSIQTPKQFWNFLIKVVSGISDNELAFRS